MLLFRASARFQPKNAFGLPAKYLDQDYLDRLGIEFCQLPFEIYQKAQRGDRE
jgi:hypothetical protein